LGKTGKLSRRPLVRTDAADMLKRRLKQAGLPAHYSPHSFRATGITNVLENDGAPWKPLNESPATPTAGRQNYMTAAARRSCSKIWRGSGIKRPVAQSPRVSPDLSPEIGHINKIQNYMPPEKAYTEALRRILKAMETGARDPNLSHLDS
jgi:hypothetical protein